MVDPLDFLYYENYLQAGLENLEGYLLSDQLFGHLGISAPVGRSYPNLTLGGLRLYQKFNQALIEGDAQRVSFQRISTQIEVLRTRWRVAWEKKATWEFKSRLQQWGNFLNEIRNQPEDHIPYYHSEVRTRAILTLLQPELGKIEDDYLEQLESQDFALRVWLDNSDFIWEPQLATAFPKSSFWYLWGLPKAL